MTRVFDQQAGSMIPVTVIDVAGNTFLQVKTADKDGYTAVQVGFDDQKEQRVNKPDARPLQEARLHARSASSASSVCADGSRPARRPIPALDALQAGQWVDVIGTTKGKGFQGVVKRHGFGGLA